MTAFLDYLKSCFSESPQENDFLSELRKKAWDHFLQTGLPTRKHDAFQYLPLSDLYNQSYEKEAPFSITKEEVLAHIYPECKHSFLVFINGVLRKDLSEMPQELVICGMQEALRSYGHFLKGRLSKNQNPDPFALLNTAFAKEGTFIFVPPKMQIQNPVQALHIFTGPGFPSLQLFVGAGAQINWLSTSLCQAGISTWVSSALDIAIEENASFHHVDLMKVPGSTWFFQTTCATLKTNSRLNIISATEGSKSFRQDYRIALNGENAEADLQGIWKLKDNAQAHTHVLMQHFAPHCRSMQSFKGILHDNSQSSFQGKIFVDQKAQKTEAYQINHNLILGPHAIANSKPNLEIFADDVKASHGATVGQLDTAQLFYLRTRGIPQELAKQFLIQGFCKETIERIPYPSVRDSLWI